MTKQTRQNLIVSIDNRITKEYEVMSIRTTAIDDAVVIQFNVQTDKMSININDLQDAIDQIKAFSEARPKPSKITIPLGINDISEQGQNKDMAVDFEMDLSN